MKGFSPAIRTGIQGVGLAAIASLTMPILTLAHGAKIQSRMTSAIEIQASYDNGQPMVKAQVQIYAPEDFQTPLFTGITDEAGQFIFVPDQSGDWQVSVRQAGHGHITVIPVEIGAPKAKTNTETESAEVNNREVNETERGVTIAEDFSNTAAFSPLQRIIIVASVTWGFVGTALFFWRNKHGRDEQWRGEQ